MRRGMKKGMSGCGRAGQLKRERAGRNGGFSLFTVLIAVSFLGILGMLLLYMSLANFQMKATDLKGKDSFYTAEQALEEIRAGLVEAVGDSMSKAYVQIMENYGVDGSGDLSQEEVRISTFRQLYVTELGKKLSDAGNAGWYSLVTLRGYLDHGDLSATGETLVVTNPAGKDPVMEKTVKGGVLLKNLKVIYVDERGRASVIQTDIRLGVPNIQFPTPSTLPDLLNTLLVADSGIVVAENATAEIMGSAYAGLSDENAADGKMDSIRLGLNSSLSVSNGEKLVCQGDVTLKEGSTFSASREVSLWALGVNLSSAAVTLEGKTYLADDLTVEAGSGSRVTIKGEYFGYGNPESYANSYNNKQDVATIPMEGSSSEAAVDNKNAASSSAIVINGKNTTMDLSGASRVMLAGKNYIAGSRVKTTDPDRQGRDIMMGESLTVKGTQVAYLLPAELFKAPNAEFTGEFHNPMSAEDCADSGILGASFEAYLDMDKKLSYWGEKSLREIGVDESEPVQMIFYNDNTGGESSVYVYFYLNFTDGESASQFMNIYYQNNPSVKAAMDQYLSFYFPASEEGKGSGILLKDPDHYLRYVTNGNVLTYDSGKASGELKGATNPGTPGENLQKEQVNYQNMWYALNRKMVNSYELLNTAVKEKNGGVHNETDRTRSVFDNLVDEETLKTDAAGGPLTFTSMDGLTALVADNASPISLDTPESVAKLRLVICTGDVVVKDVSFQGIILAKGTITLAGNASIVGAPAEAARVLQATETVGASEVSVKDYLWDGDRYVLSNTSGGQGGPDGLAVLSNTYDLSKAITYENWKKR